MKTKLNSNKLFLSFIILFFVSITCKSQCVGTPTPGITNATSTLACNGQTIGLSLSGNSPTTGITYQWQSSPNGVSWTSIPNATLVSLVQTFTGTLVYYQCVLACGVNTAASTSVSVNLLGAPIYASVPFLENFDNTWQNRCATRNVPVAANWAGSPLNGNNSWRRQDDGASGNWNTPNTATVAPLAGGGCADFHSYWVGGGQSGNLDLYVNLGANSPYTLSFYHFNANGTDSVKIYLSTNSGGTFAVQGGYGLAASWIKHTINLGPVNSPSCVVRIKGIGDFGNSDVGVDSLQIINSCINLSVSSPSTTICNGSQAIITGSGAATYTWSNGPNTSTISVTPSVTTTYTLAGSNGSCTANAFITVTVNPNPTITAISSSTAVCAGFPATLTATGANTYTWNTGAITSAIFVTPSVTTTYSVNGTFNNCINSETVTVIVNPNPTVTAVSGTSLLCAGQSATLTAGGASTYSWNTGSVNPSIIVTPTITTTYTLTGTDINGCQNSTILTQSVSSCTEVIPITLIKNIFINISPNPNNGEFNLVFSGISENLSLKIYSSIGQLIYSKIITESNYKIDLTQHPNGIYFIKLIQNGKTINTNKIIKN